MSFSKHTYVHVYCNIWCSFGSIILASFGNTILLEIFVSLKSLWLDQNNGVSCINFFILSIIFFISSTNHKSTNLIPTKISSCTVEVRESAGWDCG